MDDTDKRLQQELREDVKELTAQVTMMNARFDAFLKRAEHDIGLVKRGMFGSDSSIGLVREVDGIRRDVEDMKARNARAEADRRKLFWIIVSTSIAGAVGWLIAAIQQLIRP